MGQLCKQPRRRRKKKTTSSILPSTPPSTPPESSCKPKSEPKAEPKTKSKKKRLPKRCQKPGCYAELDLATRYVCPKCEKHVCLGHRYDFAHPCLPTEPDPSDETWQTCRKLEQNRLAFDQLVREIMSEGS